MDIPVVRNDGKRSRSRCAAWPTRAEEFETWWIGEIVAKEPVASPVRLRLYAASAEHRAV